MDLKATHDIHQRRLSRNVGVALTLVFFIAVVFGLTVVKVTSGGTVQGFDHTVRPELVPAEGN
ncbi:MAG: hypothetical protein KJN60_13925 [Boseongicola sp.]|nr:hypothetical protein [Boseongicola sp.]